MAFLYVALRRLGFYVSLWTPFSFPVLSSSVSYGALCFVVVDILFSSFFDWLGFYMLRFWGFILGWGGVLRLQSAILYFRCPVCVVSGDIIASFFLGAHAPYLKLFLLG